MSYPGAIKVPIPELPKVDGEEAWLLMLNPWMLPKDPSIPQSLLKEGNEEALEVELEKRMVANIKRLVVEWHGVTDLEGNPLPAPRGDDDPRAWEKWPRVVRLKVQQAMIAAEADMEWDPTRRQTPPKPAEQNSTPD